jgi:hypothetical protein
MKLQKQPNKWSCLVTSFAMVLDIAVETAMIMIGHNGSEVIFPLEADPKKRRSFHIQEMVDLCYNLGKCVIPIEGLPVYGIKYEDPRHLLIIEKAIDRVDKYLSKEDGVLTGIVIKDDGSKRHAVAWNHKEAMIYDPNGIVHPLSTEFRLETFWMVK